MIGLTQSMLSREGTGGSHRRVNHSLIWCLRKSSFAVNKSRAMVFLCLTQSYSNSASGAFLQRLSRLTTEPWCYSTDRTIFEITIGAKARLNPLSSLHTLAGSENSAVLLRQLLNP